MAIDRTEYINKIKTGLKANKSFTKFFYRFKSESKQYYQTFDYSDKVWDKKTRIRKAELDAYEFRDKILNPKTDLDENIKFDVFIQMHFDKLSDTTWTTTKKKHYSKYIKKHLGNKKVISIKQMHIEDCIKDQENQNLAPRTVKTTLEILNPVFKEAIINRLIDFNPCTGITIEVPRTKKIVLKASEELVHIYNTILDIFENDPMYKAFYLLVLQGRRKSEILKLRWEQIDFNIDRYLVEDTKNGEHQLNFLPKMVKDELLKFNNPTGWVFESRMKPGFRIGNIEKQTKKIKKVIPKFTLHYMRNVIVSAMAEQGVSATLMSGALGHNNTSTLSKYLTLNYVQGSQVANDTLTKILNEFNGSV